MLRSSIKLLLVVAISFLALELLLLVFNDVVFRNSFYAYDPDIGFKVRPNAAWGTFKANEFGFNDRDYPHSKQPGKLRILILGDSFNWAGGPDENYTAILENKFAMVFHDGRVEVINAGYPQTHTGEELLILEKYGMRYNPDLVILGFFVGNDFLDAEPWRRRVALGATTTDIDTRRERERIVFGQPLLFRSRFLLFLKHWTITHQFLREARAASTPHVSMGIDRYLEIEHRRMQIANKRRAAEFATNERYVFEKLSEMSAMLAAKGSKFMVVAYPDEFQVDESLRNAVIERYGIDPADYEWDRPQRVLREFAAANGIEFHDLLPVFRRAHQRGSRLYLPNDSHWNPQGNELAASEFLNILRRRAYAYFR